MFTTTSSGAIVGTNSNNKNNNHTNNSTAAAPIMDEKYEEALRRIQELEEENAQLKRTQIEINTAKELYLKIFEDFPALIWRSRLDKLCDYFNRTWLEWTGKTMEEEVGHGWTNGVHPDDFDKCLETYVTAFDRREPFYMEYRLKNKHGEYRWIGDHGRPFYDLDGEATFLGYIGSCYDITENKQNEEKLVKLNATKDKFFSIVAHDLRNPIATFVSLSEFLMETTSNDADHGGGFEPDELAEIAREMHKDSKNTLLLLENLLEWSKAQQQQQQSEDAIIAFQPTIIDVKRQLFPQVLSQVDMIAKAKKITIITTTTTTTAAPNNDVEDDIFITADPNMMNTVLRNLLSNAIKFTNKGGTIRLSACCEYADSTSTTTTTGTSAVAASAILFQVSDDGIGMPQHEIDDLFRLERSARTRPGTQNEGGSGLGLIMCKDFVEKHDGTIWAESELGKGTDIKFTIPKKQRETTRTATTTTTATL